jgi:hypothetical protein
LFQIESEPGSLDPRTPQSATSAPITPIESIMGDSLSQISPSEIRNALDKKRKHVDSKMSGVIPRHIRRGLEVCESIIQFPLKIPVGHLVYATLPNGDFGLAEVMNVDTDSNSDAYYYIHFLGKEKKEDDWVPGRSVNPIKDVNSLGVGVDELMRKLPDEQSNTQFFHLSQLTKQCTSGTSVYGASASSAHHDPHEFSPKTVRGIEFGDNRMKAWYRSPYPREFWSMSDYLKVCDKCLQYTKSGDHACISSLSAEGGTVVYEGDNDVIVYELDGQESTDFCVRLFLLAKLFLEDKRTSGVDERQVSQVTPFLFYVLTVGGTFVGYFSKYKVQKRESPILSCILVLPCEQRRGYGKVLISIAYELAKREGRQGSAERPLSGPGLAAFMSWWTWRLSTVLGDCCDGDWLSIGQISDLSGMTSEDVVETLKACGALKQWSGTGSNSDVKLRESGKRAKVKLSMELYRCLGGQMKGNIFDPKRLNDAVKLCPVVASTPTK